MCGDSTSIDAVEKLMDGHKADMVFTDPPYNVAYEGKTKESMTQALYNQEWECNFLEGEGLVFRNVRRVCTAEPKKPIDGHYYTIGIDLAKVTDWTVLCVYDRKTNEQVYQERFQKIEWPFQKSKIKAISDHYNRALCIIDATGLGDPIADDLMRAGVPVEPFKITEQTKKDLIEKLSIYIDQETIKMISTEQTLLEFDNFGYEIGPTGKIRYSAMKDYNDDIVLAQALAISDLQPLIRKQSSKPTSLIHQNYVNKIKANEEPNLEEIYW
jgi:hypothetical protein